MNTEHISPSDGGVISAAELLERIERALKRHAIPHTRFSRDAVRDPRLVHDMRLGREPRERTRARLLATLNHLEGGAANA